MIVADALPAWSIETWIAVGAFALGAIGFAFRMGSRLTGIEGKLDSMGSGMNAVQGTANKTSESVQQIALTLQAHEGRLTAVEREQDRINRERERWSSQYPKAPQQT